MEQGYLADTNAIIDYLENKLPEKSIDLIDRAILQFFVISRIELLAWSKASDSQLKILNDFINTSLVFGLTESIISKNNRNTPELSFKITGCNNCSHCYR